MVNKCIRIKTVLSENEMIEIMKKSSADFFNQNINNIDMIQNLTYKFYNFGFFLSASYLENLAGFIAFYANNMETCIGFLSMIIVIKEYQNKGIGTALLDKCIDICKENGMNKLRLEVDIKNKKAIKVYERKGFKVISKRGDSCILERNI